MIHQKNIFVAFLLYQYIIIEAKEGCPDFGSNPVSEETDRCFTSCDCRGILQCNEQFTCVKPVFETKPFCHDHIPLVGSGARAQR
eukprot:UN25559